MIQYVKLVVKVSQYKVTFYRVKLIFSSLRCILLAQMHTQIIYSGL